MSAVMNVSCFVPEAPEVFIPGLWVREKCKTVLPLIALDELLVRNILVDGQHLLKVFIYSARRELQGVDVMLPTKSGKWL